MAAATVLSSKISPQLAMPRLVVRMIEPCSYAALDLSTGQIIGKLHSRHRAIEFKQFLQTIDREVPASLDIHIVLDNSSTHKTPAIKKMAARAPAVRPALHADIQFVAQSRRTLVRRTHDETAQARRTHIRPRSQHRHPRLDRHLEPGPAPLRLDQDRRADPRIHQPLLHPNQRLTTLVRPRDLPHALASVVFVAIGCAPKDGMTVGERAPQCAALPASVVAILRKWAQ
jgi:hypothetical protein